ncbi:CRISPR-associated endonuclease Cas2 [Azoarcus sp. TTM-91]|uniref:CRISPR-associated endonuclease Cas2 n=1 Tax=Azoarcus sp. TTM-91 TaxID=2691581 RepID=UPI00145F0001|nr:CRISPR-associated endonuclease Cas2 [Azoarcus sp. TTM-91]NMG35935.1 CRISPR-associated endonuclease Cas2 [Azoarcus sp. TTM-91]
MMVLVSYDVSTREPAGERRLRRVAKACRDYGQRVQFSVFEIEVDPAQWTLLKHRLMELIDPTQDSLRFYYLGKNWKTKVEHIGAKAALDLNGPLVF